MGTRADFYVGRGENAEWLGSIAWDGYPPGIDAAVLGSISEEQYRNRLHAFFGTRDDVTLPSRGWPWPWKDSCTTDYAYAYDNGVVYASCFGHAWFVASEQEPEIEGEKVAVFPQFSKDQMATPGSTRSGITVIGL